MPLDEGKSQKTISNNIEKLMKEFQSTGKIGTSTPTNADKALRQAQAIAESKANPKKPKKAIKPNAKKPLPTLLELAKKRKSK